MLCDRLHFFAKKLHKVLYEFYIKLLESCCIKIKYRRVVYENKK